MKRERWKRSEAQLFLAPLMFFGCFMLWYYGINSPKRAEESKRQCASNLKWLALANMMYMSDHGDRYVPVSSNNVGWAVLLKPYMGVRQDFLQCPAAPLNQPDPKAPGYSSYWINANFAGQPTSISWEMTSHYLFGEGNDGHDRSDSTYALKGLPQNWIADLHSPLYRHDGACVAYCDGHVYCLNPDVVVSQSKSGAFTP